MKKTALPFLSFSKKNHAGQSIIEIVLSIGIAALVIGALIILGTVSLRTAVSSARRTEATRLAVSGVEAMRFLRDTAGFVALSAGCYQIDQNGAIVSSGACAGEADGWQQIDLLQSSSAAIFERRIKVENYGSGATELARMRKVTVQVKWPESAGGSIGGDASQREVVMTVVLSDWDQ